MDISHNNKNEDTEVEDLHLAKLCIEGNPRAQAGLFEKYSGQMMSLCMRYASDYDEAQDLFQEGFIKVFGKLHMYSGKGPLGAWVRRTMVNNALDHIRRKQREGMKLSFEDISLKGDTDEMNDPFERDEPLLPNEKLVELIGRMPTGYRTVFNLYVVEEYSHKEIAEQLEITESTSKTQYRKAKAYMRKQINEELTKQTISG